MFFGYCPLSVDVIYVPDSGQCLVNILITVVKVVINDDLRRTGK
jgi:hypothetical protein